MHAWTSEDVQLLPLGTIPLGVALYVGAGVAMDYRDSNGQGRWDLAVNVTSWGVPK